MAKIIIIGAGLTGLSAAYHLEKRGFYDYLIFEKENQPGGLCRSIGQDGFIFDYTGHLLHISDNYFQQFLDEIIGFNQLISIERKSFIYSNNVFTHYPFQTNLFGLPSPIIAECIEQFVIRPQSRAKTKSYIEWVLKHFGAGLAHHFFFPFQKKIFDYQLSEITPSWTGRFVPQTSLSCMIEGAIRDRPEISVGYNSRFFYPKSGGIKFLIDQLGKKIKQKIEVGAAVKSVDLSKKVITLSNGNQESFEYLINTMPLNELLKNIVDTPTTSLKKAADKLICNSVINFNLGIDHPNISDKHWIYFPEKEFPFYRIGFPHNFSNLMAPASFSSLYGECAVTNRSKSYVERLTIQALKKAKQFFDIKDCQIITEKIIHIPHAYVLYTHYREKNINKIHDRLNEHNIYSIGRYGGWKYSSMQEAVLDGKEIANLLTIKPAQRIRKLYEKIIFDDSTKRRNYAKRKSSTTTI